MLGLNEFLTDNFETLTENEKLRILSIFGDIFLSDETIATDRVLDQIT
jgi:hypothetical protein